MSTSTSSRSALARCTWPEIADVAEHSLLVVPFGSTEQHGRHLPFGTDTAIASALAMRLANDRGDAVVGPAMPYGSSGEHAGFPGTLSIGATATEMVMLELLRSADAFAGAVVVCGHGGNAQPLAAAQATLLAEGRRVLVWHPKVPGGDAHAGRTETSLMLALDESSVVVTEAEVGNTEPLDQLMPALRREGIAAVSTNGVLGDPTGATSEEGRSLLDRLAAELIVAVRRWWDS